MFDLSMPWWEFIVRGSSVYLVLMLLVRISGKRTVGQFTPFDLLVVMLLSESVSNSLSGEDNSLLGGLLIAMTLVALNMAMGFISTRNRRLEAAIDGSPVLLGRDGQLYDAVLRKHRVGHGEMEKVLRENDCELHEMQAAVLETDGGISITKRKS